jgi:hypothetical protein
MIGTVYLKARARQTAIDRVEAGLTMTYVDRVGGVE